MLNVVLGANSQIQPEELSFYNRQLRNVDNKILNHPMAFLFLIYGYFLTWFFIFCQSEYQNLTGISDAQVNELLQRGLSSPNGKSILF